MEKQRDTPPTQPLQPELQKPQLGQPVTATAAATAAPTALLNQQQDKSKRFEMFFLFLFSLSYVIWALLFYTF